MADSAVRAETWWMRARPGQYGDNDGAITTAGQALTAADLPGVWRARILALLPMLQRVAGHPLDAVEATARQALTVAGEAGDAVAAGHALADLWITHGVRRDHAAALDYLDQALLVLGDDPGHQDMRMYVLTVRIFTLQNLDRWTDAEL